MHDRQMFGGASDANVEDAEAACSVDALGNNSCPLAHDDRVEFKAFGAVGANDGDLVGQTEPCRLARECSGSLNEGADKDAHFYSKDRLCPPPLLTGAIGLTPQVARQGGKRAARL